MHIFATSDFYRIIDDLHDMPDEHPTAARANMVILSNTHSSGGTLAGSTSGSGPRKLVEHSAETNRRSDFYHLREEMNNKTLQKLRKHIGIF